MTCSAAFTSLVYTPENPSPEMLTKGADVLQRTSDNDDPLIRARAVWKVMYDEWRDHVAAARPEPKGE